MIEDAGGLRLADEALLELPGVFVVGVRRGADRLQRDETADERVLRQIDDAHRPLAELANDLIPAELHLVPLSPRVSSRSGRASPHEPPMITP